MKLNIEDVFISCTKLRGISLLVILNKRRYTYMCAINNRCIIANILMFHVTVPLVNYLYLTLTPASGKHYFLVL